VSLIEDGDSSSTVPLCVNYYSCLNGGTYNPATGDYADHSYTLSFAEDAECGSPQEEYFESVSDVEVVVTCGHANDILKQGPAKW